MIKCPEKHMRETRCEKNLLLFAYLITEFSDFKFFSDDNSVLFHIIALQNSHDVYQNYHFFGIHTFQLNNILNKQFYNEIFSF